MTFRYRILLEFDGAPFVGWQRQENGPSIQEAVERAVHAFSGEAVTAFAAGRTDAGVHALAMPAQFDLSREIRTDTVRDAMNAHLRPLPVAVLSATLVDPRFHVRHSARLRRYLYRIVNRRAPLALAAGKAWQIQAPLDAEAMRRAAGALVGKHHFTTFRATQCQAASPVKTLERLDVVRDAETIDVHAAAPSFLHHQVRSMVGTLVQTGLGRWSVGDVAEALAARDRTRCGQVAPPEGLYFAGADYEPSL